MAIYLNFNELKHHCAIIKISATNVAAEVGLSLEGLKKGIVNGSLALRCVLPLCQSLGITPNQFFGIPDTAPKQQVQNGGSHNKQFMDTTTIAALESQLAEKDKQISRLLDLLANK